MTRPRSFRPHIAGLRVSTLFRLYRIRLRDHPIQELLAGSGIAVGVALVFGVLIANTSITASAGEAVHSVIGSAQLQIAARSTDGFSEHLANQASTLNGVKDSAYLLRVNATVVGPSGRQSIQLVGVTAGIVGFGGSATQDLGAGESLLTGGIGLPSSVGSAIGAKPGASVTVLAAGQAHRVAVRGVLNSGVIGALANSHVAVTLLPTAQTLVGEPQRVTQVLIRTDPGAEQQVALELRKLAIGRADIEPADKELQLLNATARPTNQSTTLFAGISIMVGCLLAFNAMLLTVPERRRLIAELGTEGYTSSQLRTMLAFEASVLGLLASLVGVALGDVLAHTVLHQVPIYLAVAFPVGTNQVIHLSTVLVAIGFGVLATLFACLAPVIDLRSDGPADAVLHRPGEPGQSISKKTTAKLGALGAGIVVVVTVAVLLDTSLTVVGGILLALAAICLIPLIFNAVTAGLRPISKRIRGSMLSVAVIELDATTTRSVALAAVAALAIYGSVAIGGARSDLTRGLNATFAEYLGTTSIWVTTAGNDLTTNSFRPEQTVTKIAREPGVASAHGYQGGLLDIGLRRMWVIARSPADNAIIPGGQLIEGNARRASALLQRSGWIAVSSVFAAEHHLRVGRPFDLPTPSGLVFLRVAAVTSNIGWPPGVIILNTNDYSHYWQTANLAAIEVNLKPGVAPSVGKHEVEQAIEPRQGLRVQTTREREAQFDNNAREGLQSLADIATLLVIAAALALALALSTSIWQRRTRLASLKAQGYDRWQLWRSLLIESAIVLSIGCADGAILGVYGHALANRWLKLTTGFPAPFSLGGLNVLLTLGLVAGIALAVVALPGYSAATVPAQASFQE